MTVLFTSNRPLERAENIHAVYDAYNGDKCFIQNNPWKFSPEMLSSEFTLRVTDELPSSSPGKCIMIGHGIAGGKIYGLDQPHPYFKNENSHLIDFSITTSLEMVGLVAKQSGILPEQVLPLGMPRTDAYFGVHKGDGGTRFKDVRMYLYAPTFRTKEETPMPEVDWGYLDLCIPDGEIFVVKPHMVTKKILHGRYRHIFEVSCNEPSTPYLIDCDVLITDYSSIMFDAHILKKPVVLFEKNPGYLDSRGMYLEYPGGYSSRYCTNEYDLVKCMRSAYGQNKEDLKCLRTTAGACDGHSTERVIELIGKMV